MHHNDLLSAPPYHAKPAEVEANHRWAALLVLFLVIACGCAEPPAVPPPEGGLTPDISVGEEGEPTASIFPHTSDWRNPSVHGARVVQHGLSDCLECHKESSAQEEGPPACNSCHPLFPHASDWVQKENHGGTVLQRGRNACATQCHGFDLQGGLSGVSCNLCHTIYPHAQNWIGPGEHGEAAKGDGKSLCKGCHGEDLEGGGSGVSCRRCHVVYPHEDNWRRPDRHGEFVAANGRGDCATRCHGLDLKGGLSGVSCNRCHQVYPHTERWEEDHGKVAGETGKGICQGCHGADFKTLLDGRDCFSCHGDYPHPEAAIWRPYSGGHGERVNETHRGETVSCQLCHGDDLKTMKKGKNCFSCHPSFPHRDTEEVVWEKFGGHGTYALEHSKVECQLCHGGDYQGGERGNRSCYECHKSYPHVTGWRRPRGEPQGHGEYVKINSTTSCATERCHGVDLNPIPGFSKGPNCRSCHSVFPHQEGWESGLLHGPTAAADIGLCKSCHGNALNQAPEGYRTCRDCHPTYLRHRTAGMGGNDWGSSHGRFVREPPNQGDLRECQICHGADFSGGVSGRGCRGCHPSFPHDTPGWKETFAGHGNYVLTTLGNDKTPCKLCHGNDLRGGNSGRTCYRCHQTYPHDGNWRLPSEHGVTAYGSGKNDCTDCHGTDFEGNLPQVPSCYGCHQEFPHTLAGWVNGPASVHAATFIQRMREGEVDACSECHGDNYDRPVGEGRCTGCHTNGVTHRARLVTTGFGITRIPWSAGSEHGRYVEASCWDCHGAPVTFTDVQTRETLQADSTCYRCHWAYPHIGYDVPDYDPGDGSEVWETEVGGNGHHYYLTRSGLFTNPAGRHPEGADDPAAIPAIRNTCGGNSVGLCHFNGIRSRPSGSNSRLCGQYCHRS